MNIYTTSDDYLPYTYLIGWSQLDKWYYGSKTSKSKQHIANPKTLWNGYYTSSAYVKKFRELHGEPDIICVRRTFKSREQALLWEHKVLKRLGVGKSTKWLNKSISGSKFNCALLGDDNPSRRDDVKQKISSALTGRPKTKEHKIKLSNAKCGHNKGKTYEEIYGINKAEELKKIRSVSMTGRPKSLKQIEKSRVAKSKWWRIYPPNEEPIIVLSLNQYCMANDLDTSHMWDTAQQPYGTDGKLRYYKGFRVEKMISKDDELVIDEFSQQHIKADNKTKLYQITTPCGSKEVVRGLGEYAKTHGWPPGALYDVRDKLCVNGDPRKYKGFVVKTIQ